jgi:DUF4097 and DUF4098 domain-containing protein YvlB
MRHLFAAIAIVLLIHAPALAQNRNRQPQRTERETRTLALGANGSLDLETVGGTIVVNRGSSQDTVVEIVKEARSRSDADAEQALKGVTVNVDVRGQRATVQAVFPDRQRSGDVTVSYTVTTPAGTRLNAETVGGDVRISGIRGELSASSVGGTITVTDAGQVVSLTTIGGNISLTGADTDNTLKVETVGGSIRIQQTKARRLAANAVGGDITATDLTAENVDIGTMSGNLQFSGPIAKAGRYDLHTQSGNVHVTPAGGSGFELQARTFSGSITTGASMSVQGSTTRGPNREVRGMIGDGSAVVIARTFSGDVVVGK